MRLNFADILLYPAIDEGPIVDNALIKPVLERVWRNDDGTCTALWGYLSKNSVEITVPLKRNRFSPGPGNRGQPGVFQPGRQYGVFETVFDTVRLVWSLMGPDEKNRTATAGCLKS